MTKLTDSTHKVVSPFTGFDDILHLSGEVKLEGVFTGFDQSMINNGTIADTETRFTLDIIANDTNSSPELTLELDKPDGKESVSIKLDEFMSLMLDRAGNQMASESEQSDFQSMSTQQKVESKQALQQEQASLLPDWAIPEVGVNRLDFENVLRSHGTDWLTWSKNYADAARARRPDALIFQKANGVL